MNLRQIEVFHAVYSAGSISAASRLLNVSQPSVSKVVKHTETRLGFALFRLVRGRLVPTEEAHVLFRDVDDLYERIGIFQRTARNLKSSLEGRIRIGVLPSLALSIVPDAISRFRIIAPRASFEISTIHHDDFREMLTSRECDLVIGHHLLHEPEIESVSLGTGRVGALFRRDLLTFVPKTIPMAMLSQYDIIGLAPSVAIAGLVGPVVEPLWEGRQRPITVRTVYVAAALARQGEGIAIVDEFTARGLLSPELCFVPIQPDVRFELSGLHLADHPLTRPARSFLNIVAAMIAAPATVEPADEDVETYPQAIAVANH